MEKIGLLALSIKTFLSAIIVSVDLWQYYLSDVQLQVHKTLYKMSNLSMHLESAQIS